MTEPMAPAMQRYIPSMEGGNTLAQKVNITKLEE
jgi:hypothetical protein